jgi:uncharacterized membrane protein
MIDYLYKSFLVWFLGFFPLFEIYVAVPAGMAMGLDPFSVVLSSVTGNFAPVLLIDYGYRWLISFSRIRKWLRKPVSSRLVENVNRYGVWYVILITPWTGVWIMAAAAKVLQMRREIIFWGSLAGITLYAIAITGLILLGVDIFVD